MSDGNWVIRSRRGQRPGFEYEGTVTSAEGMGGWVFFNHDSQPWWPLATQGHSVTRHGPNRRHRLLQPSGWSPWWLSTQKGTMRLLIRILYTTGELGPSLRAVRAASARVLFSLSTTQLY